jgi:hypothetical protein
MTSTAPARWLDLWKKAGDPRRTRTFNPEINRLDPGIDPGRSASSPKLSGGATDLAEP